MELLEGMYHNAVKGCVCFVVNINLGILNMHVSQYKDFLLTLIDVDFVCGYLTFITVESVFWDCTKNQA